MEDQTAESVRQKLIEAGGRMSQDLGLGRIVGQILIYLYLSQEESSLDEIGEYLGLSKASSSIAARQLERLGMIIRVWKKGDRKSYYRTADNFMPALQKGFVEFVKQKLLIIGSEIETANTLLEKVATNDKTDSILFLDKKIKRAMKLKSKIEKISDNILVKILT